MSSEEYSKKEILQPKMIIFSLFLVVKAFFSLCTFFSLWQVKHVCDLVFIDPSSLGSTKLLG